MDFRIGPPALHFYYSRVAFALAQVPATTTTAAKSRLCGSGRRVNCLSDSSGVTDNRRELGGYYIHLAANIICS